MGIYEYKQKIINGLSPKIIMSDFILVFTGFQIGCDLWMKITILPLYYDLTMVIS